MAFSGPMEDRLAIRELYDTYGDGSSRGDVDTFLSCWTDDCQWNTHVFSRSGKDEITTQWHELWANFEKVAFFGNVFAIEVDGDTASARSIAREIVGLKGGGVFKLSGLYHDKLVRQNGQWLFKQRNYEMLVEELPRQA